MKIKVNHNYGNGRAEVLNIDQRFKKSLPVYNSSDPRINATKVFKKLNRKQTIKRAQNTAGKIGNITRNTFCLLLLAGGIHSGMINSTEATDPPDYSDLPPVIIEPTTATFESAEIPAGMFEAEEPTLRDLYIKHFGDKAGEAEAIAQCESGQIPDRHNLNHKTKDDSYGLFQVNLYGNLKNSRPAPEWLVNPDNNIQYAKMLFDNSGGWSKHWVNCSRKLNLK